MPLITSSQDYLPFVDQPCSDSDISAAKALINAELPPDHQTAFHPSLPILPEPHFSDLISAEHARIASGAPKEPGIDLTRYEAQDAPTTHDSAQWRSTLQKAYASSEYLQSRLTNLSLLETYGKNAWLISNDQLEALLLAAEREVEGMKREVEDLERARRAGQEARKGEVEALEQSWRTGVGRMIEVEVAAESLRREVLERKRAGAR